MKKVLLVVLLLALCGGGYYWYRVYQSKKLSENPDFICGNGRIEATEVSISAKLSGRLEEITVNEGDYVSKGQLLGCTQINVLTANLAAAKAKLSQAKAAKLSKEATVKQRQSIYDGAEKTYKRYLELKEKNATSLQSFENAETEYNSAKASLVLAQADLEGAIANIEAAEAEIAVVQANLDDSRLVAPIDGRIQYRIAEPGEVIASGGRVLNLIDLTDVYMNFFLPEAQAGKVKIGTEVRIVLDALPNTPIPARVTFVSDVAQFTPKTVETKVERQKLMFRVKAKIDPELLKRHLDQVKIGLPGVAWIKLNPDAQWPKELELKPL